MSNTVVNPWDGPGCFTADTKISLLNGTEVPIKDLVGLKEFWVYSCTPEGKIVPGRAHSARVTHTNAELVEVTLDNDEKIRCTPDHPFMMRDGTYKEAKDLKKDDSLMPLYRRYDDSSLPGYELVYCPGTTNWELTHRLYTSKDLVSVRWNREGKKLELCEYTLEHRVRHHLDFNERDNTPENVVWITGGDHHRFHRNIVGDIFKRLWQDQEWAKKAKSRARGLMLKLRKNPVLMEKVRKLSAKRFIRMWRDERAELTEARRTSMLDMWKTNPGFVLAARENGRRQSKNFIPYYSSPEWRESCKIRMISLNKTSSFMYNRLKRLAIMNNVSKICDLCGLVCGNVGSLGRHKKSAHPTNHKVLLVRHLDQKEDVYDFSVDTYSNFALPSGVFVHNSFPYTGTIPGFLEYKGVQALLRSAIEHILMTRRGERVMRPLLGSTIPDKVFDPNDDILENLIRGEISNALAIWDEDRIQLISVNTTRSEEYLTVKIVYKMAKDPLSAEINSMELQIPQGIGVARVV